MRSYGERGSGREDAGVEWPPQGRRAPDDEEVAGHGEDTHDWHADQPNQAEQGNEGEDDSAHGLAPMLRGRLRWCTVWWMGRVMRWLLSSRRTLG
jgi:hypothetical protein